MCFSCDNDFASVFKLSLLIILFAGCFFFQWNLIFVFRYERLAIYKFYLSLVIKINFIKNQTDALNCEEEISYYYLTGRNSLVKIE